MSILIRQLAKLKLAFLKRYWNLSGSAVLKAQGVKLVGRTVFYGIPIATKKEPSSIVIGNNVVLCSDSRFTALGVARPVILRTLRKGAEITIGSDTGLSGCTISAAVSVTIGERCLIGADVMICDTDFHAISPDNRRYNNDESAIQCKAVKIGNDVFIGARAIVLKGAEIGNGAIIGAGSIVTGKIAPRTIATGNPAKVLKEIT